MPGIGKEGQERILKSKVLVVGLGGLGSSVAYYLAAAGIGMLGIVDYDFVDITNLNRQILYKEEDLGKSKTEIAKDELKRLNSEIKIIPYHLRLTKENIGEIFKKYDIIVDCSDNFDTRYLINDIAVLFSKPFVHGALLGYEGHVTTIDVKKGPCYRCLFKEPPPSGTTPCCREAGVLGALAGVVGSIQSLEVFKLVLGIGNPLVGELLTFDVLKSSFRKINFIKNKNCIACCKKESNNLFEGNYIDA